MLAVGSKSSPEDRLAKDERASIGRNSSGMTAPTRMVSRLLKRNFLIENTLCPEQHPSTLDLQRITKLENGVESIWRFS
jgi:hypothetical protein